MVNTPGRSINEKNRRASGGLFFLPIFLGTSTVYGSNHRGLNLSRLGWRLWN